MADPLMTPGPVRHVSRSHSPLTTGTWVLVADGEKALLMENVGDAERPLLEVRREAHGENPATHEQGSDRPGRRQGGPGAQRSAMEETDWHRLEETRFAEGLAEMLTRRVRAEGIGRLILVAAPRVLGELRRKMHKEVAARVVAEAPMTLTNHPVDEMARRLADALTADAGPPDS